MIELFERIIMAQLLKTLALSKSEDQKAMLDTILDGANKAAQTVANIRSIKEGQEPKILDPLYKEQPPVNFKTQEKELTMMQEPTPPKSMQQKTAYTNTYEEIYMDLNNIRKKLDTFFESGVCGKNELNELQIDIYAMQTKIWNFIRSNGQ